MSEKVWTKCEIKKLLETNDKMVSKSVVKLYEYQTRAEQEVKETHEHNGVGFNSIDATFLTSIAERVIAGKSLIKGGHYD